MRLKDFFPFSLQEYLKVFSSYIIFFAILYLLAYLFPSYVSSLPLSPAYEAEAAKYAYSLLFLMMGFALAMFLLLTLLTAFVYSVAAKKGFKGRLWPKYAFASIMLALIFLIPFMFAMRLSGEGSTAGPAVFIILLLVLLHFSNLVFLFIALTERTFRGIRKGFSFGTKRIKHLVFPYIIFLAVSAVLSLLMKLISLKFLNLIISGMFISWAVLYVGRNILKKPGVTSLRR